MLDFLSMQTLPKSCSLVFLAVLLISGGSAHTLRAADGHEAWLRYAPLEKSAGQTYRTLPESVVVLGNSSILSSAQEELLRGIQGMLSKTLHVSAAPAKESAFVLATLAEAHTAAPELRP